MQKSEGLSAFYFLIFWLGSIIILYNLRAICLSLTIIQIWEMAVRVWLETAIPPVFGKETDEE